MNNILKGAKFEKVSFEQFYKDFVDCNETCDKNMVKESIYDCIKLPKRATKNSAGYDFFAPYKIMLKPGETIKVPTGIRCKLPEEFVLQLFPRSGLGFKYRMQLNNTVGIIDADYYDAKNEGHIMAKITNDTNENKTISIEAGEGFMQGLIQMYFITEDDESTEVRVGGFGSTTNK